MAVAFQGRSQRYNGDSRSWHRGSIAVIQRAVKRTGRLSGSVAILNDCALSEVNAGRSKRTHSADVPYELNVLHLAAVVQIDQPSEIGAVGEGKSHGAKRIRDRAS